MLQHDSPTLSSVEAQQPANPTELMAESFNVQHHEDTLASQPIEVTPSQGTGGLMFHSLANVFPLIEGSEFEAFCEDISNNGQREPIVLFEGKILDGRNRYRATVALNIEPRIEEYTGDNPLEYVLSMNMYRRQLTVAQRSIIAAQIVCREPSTDDAGDDEPGHLQPGLGLAQAATLLGISERSISSASRVARTGSDALLNAVKSGKVKISTAEYVAKLDQEEQDDLIACGAKAVRDKAREMRLERSRRDAAKPNQAEMIPEGKAPVGEPLISNTNEPALKDSAKAMFAFAKVARRRGQSPAVIAELILREIETSDSPDTEAEEIIFATEVAAKLRERMIQIALVETAR